MIEIHEDLQALLQDAMGLAALDVDDEADAAGIVLERGIVETLLRRQTRPARTTPFSAAAHACFPSPVFNSRSSGRCANAPLGIVKTLIQQESAARLSASPGVLRRRPVEYNPEDRGHITEVDTCVNAPASPRS
jgi:hypothetical protein